MSTHYQLRHLKIRDLIRIASDADNQTATNPNLYVILNETIHTFPSTWAATEAKDSYLFHINHRAREEWENTLFYFYCAGRLFKIRRLKGSSGDVSFQGFPKTQEHLRDAVMHSFVEAAAVYGGYGHGPDGSFVGTLKGLDHRFDPVFLHDDIMPPASF